MEIETPLVDKDYLLLKTEGKGTWTFVEIPEIPMPKTSFGMLKVKLCVFQYTPNAYWKWTCGFGC